MVKLVRDKIPKIIKDSGDTPITHTASDDEYLTSLLEKLQEEVDEYIEDKEPAELIDILEVVYALATTHNLSQDQLESLRSKKLELRGGFKSKTILERVKSK